MFERIHGATNHLVHYLVMFVAVLIITGLVVTFALPVKKAEAQLLPFGGRIIVSFPTGFYTLYVNCPPMTIIYDIYTRTTFGLLIPPAQPKLFYNFYTPGVAVLGNRSPVPLLINCFLPVYPTNYWGTSGV
jgi:hypothetical protein